MGFTKQRKTILSILSESREHLTADQVFERARQPMPNIGKGTVYRNLNLMADEGVIRRLQVPGHSIRFDGNTAAHQHLVCVHCGSIEDTGDIEPAALKTLVDAQTEFVHHTLLLYVVCQACSAQQ